MKIETNDIQVNVTAFENIWKKLNCI